VIGRPAGLARRRFAIGSLQLSGIHHPAAALVRSPPLAAPSTTTSGRWPPRDRVLEFAPPPNGDPKLVIDPCHCRRSEGSLEFRRSARLTAGSEGLIENFKPDIFQLATVGIVGAHRPSGKSTLVKLLTAASTSGIRAGNPAGWGLADCVISRGL